MIRAVYRVDYTEIEHGWGERSDGLSLSKDQSEVDKILKRYKKDSMTDYYTWKAGTPYLVDVNQDIYDQVQEQGTVWFNYYSDKRGYH